MKKVITLFVVFVLIFSLCACGNNAIDESPIDDVITNVDISTDVTDDGIEIDATENITNIDINQDANNFVSKNEDFVGLDTDEGYCVVDYVGESQIIKIPETLNGKIVEGIGIATFDDIEIKEIYFSSNIKKITYLTFKDQTSLEKVVLNEGLQEIGDDAFANCSSLKEINIPSTVERIGNRAFSKCVSLSEITLSEGLSSIGFECFAETNLTSFTIPATVESINHDAFINCKNLKAIHVLNPDTGFNGKVFEGCPNIVMYGALDSNVEFYAECENIPFVAE